MNVRHRLSVAAGLVGLSVALSLVAAPSLPEQLATHWSATGEPDGTMAKGPALAMFPILTAGLVALLAAVPRIDPLGENVEAFRAHYDWFVVALAAFMLVVHGGIVAYNLATSSISRCSSSRRSPSCSITSESCSRTPSATGSSAFARHGR